MGKVMLSGVAPKMTVPSTKIRASDLAVGSVVKLMENGVATEYLVVNQGIPSGSSLYDNSCDGTWLLRKELIGEMPFNSNNTNDYANSTIHSYLNGDFFNQFGNAEQFAIKQVKIPYRYSSGTGSTVYSGSNGLQTKVFIPSSHEISNDNVGNLNGDNNFVKIGVCLEYFDGEAMTSEKRKGYYNATATMWTTRAPYIYYSNVMAIVQENGVLNAFSSITVTTQCGIRPAIILKSTAIFDENTLLLKGVA